MFVLIAGNSLFVVKETERAVMLRFGEVVNSDIAPGLHVKIPWVNTVRKFDARIQTEDAPSERFLTLEQKALEVDSYAKWRILDVGQFYVSTRGNAGTAGSLLAERINDGLRDQIGARTLIEVVSGERDELMTDLTQDLNRTTASDIGIEVIDVRVKRIDLPDDVRSSVYDRMITERNREAQELRSRGKSLRLAFAQMRIARLLSLRRRPIEMLNAFVVRVTLRRPVSMPLRIIKIRNSTPLPAA